MKRGDTGSDQLVSICVHTDYDDRKCLTPLMNIYDSTGGSHLSQIFWEHENLSSLSVIWLIYIKLYRRKEKNWQKIQAKWESGLTVVSLKRDPPIDDFFLVLYM